MKTITNKTAQVIAKSFIVTGYRTYYAIRPNGVQILVYLNKHKAVSFSCKSGGYVTVKYITDRTVTSERKFRGANNVLDQFTWAF